MDKTAQQNQAAYAACIPLLVFLATNGALGLAAGTVRPAAGETAALCLSAAVYVLSMAAALFTAARTAGSVGPIPPAPSKKGRLRAAGLLLAAPGLAMALNGAAGALLRGMGLDAGQSVPLWPQTIAGRALFLVTHAVLPAVLEELLFRRYTLRALLPLGSRRAALVSALLFALCHPALAVQPGAFLLGACLALACLETGSLLPGMAVHLLNNGLAALQLARPAWDSLGPCILTAMALLGIALLLAAGRQARSTARRAPMDGFWRSGPFVAFLAIALMLAISKVEKGI